MRFKRGGLSSLSLLIASDLTGGVRKQINGRLMIFSGALDLATAPPPPPPLVLKETLRWRLKLRPPSQTNAPMRSASSAAPQSATQIRCACLRVHRGHRGHGLFGICINGGSLFMCRICTVATALSPIVMLVCRSMNDVQPEV